MEKYGVIDSGVTPVMGKALKMASVKPKNSASLTPTNHQYHQLNFLDDDIHKRMSNAVVTKTK